MEQRTYIHVFASGLKKGQICGPPLRDTNTRTTCYLHKRCPHNRQYTGCKNCRGGSICQHNRCRARCKDCKGSGICKHNKRKERCENTKELLFAIMAEYENNA